MSRQSWIFIFFPIFPLIFSKKWSKYLQKALLLPYPRIRIQIHIILYGSGSGKMIWILTDPDPYPWFLENVVWKRISVLDPDPVGSGSRDHKMDF